MTAGYQEKSVAGLLADLGVTGFSGIAATIGSPNTKLDITVTPPAWAVLTDGTVLASELVTTSITGLTSNSSSLHLWLDYATGGAQGTDYSPSWSVAVTAPSANALKIADITVGSNHLTVVTMVATGLQGLPISGVTSAELTALLAAIPTIAVADIADPAALTAVPGSFADTAAVQAYLAGANVLPLVESRLENLEDKVNALLAQLRLAGIVTP